MSVLIKGMSMPKNCESCIISRISSTGESLRCGFTYDVVRWDGKEEIPFDCPLVELPPHGDLIDRDAIPWRNANHPTAGKWIDEAHIRIMPTIVEAEDET